MLRLIHVLLFFYLINSSVHGRSCFMFRKHDKFNGCDEECCKSNLSRYDIQQESFLNQTHKRTRYGIFLEDKNSTSSTTIYGWCSSTNQCNNGEMCYFASDTQVGICVPCTMIKMEDKMSIYVDSSKCGSTYSEHRYNNELRTGSLCTNSLKCSNGSSCLGLLTNGSLASCNGNIGNSSFETPCYCHGETDSCYEDDQTYGCCRDVIHGGKRYCRPSNVL